MSSRDPWLPSDWPQAICFVALVFLAGVALVLLAGSIIHRIFD